MNHISSKSEVVHCMNKSHFKDLLAGTCQASVARMFCAGLVQPSFFVNLVLVHTKQRDTSVRQLLWDFQPPECSI